MSSSGGGKTEKKKSSASPSSSSKGDKKSKSSSSSSSKSKTKPPKDEKKTTTTHPTHPQTTSQGDIEGSSDFEAGLMFNKYDPTNSGAITSTAFREMWKEKLGQNKGSNLSNHPGNNNTAMKSNPFSSFDAGAIFAKYDQDQDGKLNKKDFEELILAHPELLTNQNRENKNYNLPHEVITGRLLTHYDETAGVAIPKSAVSNHEQMGNTVRPLVAAYTERYSRLRTMLTSKLLPRRENILQLRRQLTHTSNDVEAARVAIERETRADAENIIERLRNIESMRQSSIQHQIIQLEEELDQIERLVRRVEVANERNNANSSNGIVLTSAASGISATNRHISWSENQPGLEAVTNPRADMMVELIQQFSDLMISIERLTNKQLLVQVEYPTDDFPKEVSERLEIIARCDKYRYALSVKDHMLWLALNDKERAEEAANQEKSLSIEYAEEMNQWAELASDLKLQLKEEKRENEKLREENNKLLNLLRTHGVHLAR